MINYFSRLDKWYGDEINTFSNSKIYVNPILQRWGHKYNYYLQVVPKPLLATDWLHYIREEYFTQFYRHFLSYSRLEAYKIKVPEYPTLHILETNFSHYEKDQTTQGVNMEWHKFTFGLSWISTLNVEHKVWAANSKSKQVFFHYINYLWWNCRKHSVPLSHYTAIAPYSKISPWQQQTRISAAALHIWP